MNHLKKLYTILKKFSIYIYLLSYYCPIYGSSDFEDIKDVIDHFEKLSKEIIAYCKVPGAAIAIVTPKEILSLKTYGVKCLNTKEAIDENTLFRVGSLSKTCTSLLVAKLDKKGIISLEAPITQYMPSICIHNQVHTSHIKVKYLLNHTSGMAPYSLEEKAYKHQNFNELTACLPTIRKICAPGKQFHYQNVLFSFIGPIVSSVSSYGFTDSLKKEILNPLGIVSYSLTNVSYASNNNRASPHIRKNFSTHIVHTGRSYYDNILPAAGMAFSIKSIAKLLQACIGGYPDILDKDILGRVITPSVFVSKGIHFCKRKNCLCKQHIIEYYGLGCRITYAKIHKKQYSYISHYGILKGFTAGFTYSPDHKIGIVVLTNSNQSPVPELLTQFFIKMIHNRSIVKNQYKILAHWKNNIVPHIDKNCCQLSDIFLKMEVL